MIGFIGNNYNQLQQLTINECLRIAPFLTGLCLSFLLVFLLPWLTSFWFTNHSLLLRTTCESLRTNDEWRVTVFQELLHNDYYLTYQKWNIWIFIGPNGNVIGCPIVSNLVGEASDIDYDILIRVLNIKLFENNDCNSSSKHSTFSQSYWVFGLFRRPVF
jgi:hypothetical protein